MALLGDLMQLGGVIIVGAGLVYMYQKGMFDEILQKKETAAEEPEPKEEKKGTGTGDEETGDEEPEPKDEIDVITTKCAKYGARCNNECHNGSQITEDCKACVICRGGNVNLRCKSGYKWVAATDRSKRCVPTTTTAPKPKTTIPTSTAAVGACRQKCRDQCAPLMGKGGYPACRDGCYIAKCGGAANLALVYAGSYYDGQVTDTAYYVTAVAGA